MATTTLAQTTQPTTLTVQVNRPGAAISPRLWGIFFEDINFSADGGIYPERIKNGSFEFDDRIMGWRKVERGGAVGGLGVVDDDPIHPNNPHFLRMIVENPGDGFGLSNDGFRGIGVTQGAKFRFSAYVRVRESADPVTLAIELRDGSGRRVIGQGTLGGFSGEWKQYSCDIESAATDNNARLFILARGAGRIDMDMVSLFPYDTYKNRRNGLRPDLVQLLADLKPSFIRFPGGCIVEGRVLEHRYQWKNTIGELAHRKLIMNRWNVEFGPPRNAPDYYQSYGVGFFEYFQLCEDIGAEPLPILNCGMGCQYNFGELVPLDELQPYIQDALDLIEFANGPVTSQWGAKRAAMGHPEPFNMKMLGIGNEQWGPQYFERYEKFVEALKQKHPEITLISSSGPQPDGEEFDFAWKRLREINAEVVDEHYYRPPDWFYRQVNRYDNYDRGGPKVFAGEFAAHTRGRRNNLEAALAEAALMTGIERNGDHVVLASYAPLLAHTQAWQWAPNLIWFDNLRSNGTPSYYVQKLFSTNRGTHVLPMQLGGESDRVYASAVIDQASNDVILKIVNAADHPRKVNLNLEGVGSLASRGQAQVLTGPEPEAENSLDDPTRVSPASTEFDVSGTRFDRDLPPHSLTVLRLTAS